MRAEDQKLNLEWPKGIPQHQCPNFSQFLKYVHTGLSVSQKRTASLPAIDMTLAL